MKWLPKIFTIYDEKRPEIGPLMTRVILGRWRFHIIYRGDHDDMHDHPWDFWTFPLRGYWEIYREPGEEFSDIRFVKPFRWHFRRAELLHRIVGPAAHRRRIYTYVVTGEKRREWGFWRKKNVYDQGCWVYWRDYVFGGGKNSPCSQSQSEITR